MALLKKRNGDRTAEINASSMADITFLLLLFFLVTTTIDVDTGIGMTLPEWQNDKSNTAQVSADRLLSIQVRGSNDVLMGTTTKDMNPTTIPDIKKELVRRLKEKIGVPANKALIVSIKPVDCKYQDYIAALDEVKAAFFEVKDEYCITHFNKKRYQITKAEKRELEENIRETISLAENIKKK